MKKRFTSFLAALALLVFMMPSQAGWGQTKDDPTVLFHETFGNNPNSARAWNDSYSVKSGVEAVYSGITSYTVSNVKQGKNTTGQTLSGLNQSTANTDAYIIFGPLNVSNYESLNVTYYWKAGSITNNTYSTHLYYATSSNGTYTEVSGTGNGATTFVQRSYSLPESCQISTLYLKVVFNTSNTQAIIDEFELKGISSGGSYTITVQSNNSTFGTVSLSGNVITGSPNSGYRYASPAYTVTSGTATVSQSGNDFTVTPSSDCTVQINFEAIPKHTATFSVNGNTSQTASVAEGAAITFPSDPANISGRKFVGWVTETIAEPTDEEPSFVNTATETMGNSNVTYYAVFATATASGDHVETLTQTLEYDTWTYGGATTNITGNSPYRLFHDGGYVESAAFDLSKLSKVIVYGGSYGGNYTSLTIGDVDNNKWKDVNVSGNSQTGENTFTDGNSLSGTKKLRVTSTCGSSSKALSGVRMTKVKIYTMEASYIYSEYCTNVEVYTITAASNNTDYGTVSLSGEVITGSPQSGCRYATPAYTVSPANSATVVQDGNEFTVTPSANTTVTINFELIPTYTLSSAVSPENAGMVTLGASSGLLEGATVSAEAAANAGYKFTGWSISGTGATLSSPTDNPTTVTIGTANATVTATFEEVTTYAITYSVNGVPNTVNVEENTAVDLSAPSSALIPVGYVFKGWRIATLDPTDTDPNDYVTSATSTADITYYAVMAAESLSNSTYTLNYDTDVSSLSLGYGTAVGVTASDGSAWVVKAYKNNGMQINTGKNSSIKVPICSGNIQSIAITCTVAKAVGFSIIDYSGSGTITYVVYGTEATSQTLDLSSHSVTCGYIVPKGGSTSITNIVVTYKVTTYSNFCTSVSTIALTDDVTIDGNLNISYELTVPSGKTLTVTGNLINTNPANLVIEDGGQLIIPDNTKVKATVQKATAGSSAEKTEANNLYAISSPVDGIEISSFAQGYAPSGAHNVYRYDEPSNCWQEYRNTSNVFTTLTNGRGYLYRSSEAGVDFAGDVTGGDEDGEVKYTLSYAYGVAKYKGLNLVGNPFTHNITWNNLTLENVEKGGCYVLNETPGGANQGKWQAVVKESVDIKPTQAFFVQATDERASITFKNTAGGGKGENYANDNIMFSVKNSKCSDEAYVMFAEGHGLNKIEHRNSEIPMLYIMNNGQNYAIADMSDDTEVINIGFEAKTMGQYTFSIKTEGQYSYMHLVDKLTGEDVDMLVEDSYTFVGAPNDRKDRFVLNLNYNAANINTDSDIFAYQSGSDIIIRGDGELHVFDVMGRLVLTQRVNGVETISVQSQGVYIFKLNGMTQKIVVR